MFHVNEKCLRTACQIKMPFWGGRDIFKANSSSQEELCDTRVC